MGSDQERPDPEETAKSQRDKAEDNIQTMADYADLVGDHAEAKYAESSELLAQGDNEGAREAKLDAIGWLSVKMWIVVGLVLIIALVAIVAGFDVFGPPDDVEAPWESSGGDSAPVSAPGDSAAGDSVALTDGPWRFFFDSSEAKAMYDIKFEEDGTCSVPGDTVVYAGEYTVDGASVEIVLHRRSDNEAKDGLGGVRTETVDWDEWFHMTRAGDTMSGSWEVERWQLEYDEGLLWEGVEDSGYVVFARPE